MAMTPTVPSLPSLPAQSTMLYNLPRIVDQVTDLYIRDKLLAPTPGNMPDPGEAQLELLQYIQQLVISENGYRPRRDQIKTPEVLPPTSIAKLANAMFSIYRIPCAGSESDPNYDVLGIYQSSGPDTGTYVTSKLEFERLIHRYNSLYKPQEFTQFMNILAQIAERRTPCRDPDLVAVNNGIFNVRTKRLQPFDPDLVFLSKSRVDYVPSPVNPVIHNPDDGTDWDVESWMAALSDDPEVVQLLWEIMGAIIRPNVPWNKSAWFYSETGNNGKGTLCELMRNLAGKSTCASISLADFGKDFLLEPLMRASCIIVDENDVGTYIDKGANLKAVITGDVLQINRKYEKPVAFQFHGLMVQCLNELPRIKDKSESLYRRQLFVPFTKCFTGAERKYIKEDYLSRPEVLQYVLWRVLNMDYYELSNPKACQDVLDVYKDFNDPVRQFIDEVFEDLQWDVVPLTYLFDLYKAWLARTNPGGSPLGKKTFNMALATHAGSIPGWLFTTDRVYPTMTSMGVPEPLTGAYELKSWYNPTFSGNVTGPNSSKFIPPVKKHYTGAFLRAVPRHGPASVPSSPPTK